MEFLIKNIPAEEYLILRIYDLPTFEADKEL
jgi:hypothetical protein